MATPWELRCHKAALRHRSSIVGVGNYSWPKYGLPPLRLELVVIAAVLGACVFGVWVMTPLRNLIPLPLVVLGIGTATWAVGRIEVDGKRLWRWLFAQLAFVVRGRERHALSRSHSLGGGLMRRELVTRPGGAGIHALPARIVAGRVRTMRAHVPVKLVASGKEIRVSAAKRSRVRVLTPAGRVGGSPQAPFELRLGARPRVRSVS